MKLRAGVSSSHRGACAISNVALLFALLCGPVAAAVWDGSDLEKARTVAKITGRPLMVIFTLDGSLPNQRLDTTLREPRVESVTTDKLEVVKVDLQRHAELAQYLGGFRAGVAHCYDSSGAAISRTGDVTGAGQLEEYIRTIPPPSVGTSEMELQQNASASPPSPLPKGKQVADAVILPTTSPQTLIVATLEAGKEYVVTVSGEVSLWSKVVPKGADACFKCRAQERVPYPAVVFRFPNASMLDLVRATTGKEAVLHPDHTYEAMVRGEGAELQVKVGDAKLTDNCGEFTISVYEAP